jgi:DNA-binding response OmpR family regulator
MRLLLVEDNAELAALLGRQLRASHFDVDHTSTVADALILAETRDYAVVILDIGLPDGSGLDLLRRLRDQGKTLPILVLTARGSVDDRVTGLDSGADDYLVKPFAYEELKARITALLRRPGTLLGRLLEAGGIRYDTGSREVWVNGQPVACPQREAQLLELLLRRAGKVVPKNMVEDQIFGVDDEIGSNAVEVYVHRLRKRLEQHQAKASIHTIRGVGYLLAAETK